MDLVVHVGDLETLAQLTSAEVLRLKTSVLENRQLPRTHELKTIYHHFQASCHKLYTMLLGDQIIIWPFIYLFFKKIS